jgi:hypothetical protein
MIRRGLTANQTPTFSLCNGSSCIALGFSSFHTHWTFGPPLFHKLGYTRHCENWRARIFTTKLTDTFSVSFFPCKRFDNKHTLFNTEHTSNKTDDATSLQRHNQTTSRPAVISANDSFCYWAVNVSHLLCDRIISRGLWPPRSPDLSFCDLYLWGYLKGKVYKNNPRSIEALRNEITRVIGSITVDQFHKLSQNLFMRCKACLQAEVVTFNTCYKAQ